MTSQVEESAERGLWGFLQDIDEEGWDKKEVDSTI
jgi:hypothetical protein